MKKEAYLGGGYIFWMDDDNYKLYCDRHGERKWREFTGDKAVTLLFLHVLELYAALDET
jgi:hypothetical protein